MEAGTLTFKKLFAKDVRYLIPPFQRPYVWTQEDQWEPLWDDIRNAAERYMDALLTAGKDQPAEAESIAGSNFLGAVVIQQAPTPTPDLEARHVIDGQQRMTTLQLVLDAAQEVTERLDLEKAAQKLAQLVTNNPLFVTEPDERFKLWPTTVDEAAFRAAMDNEAATEGFAESRIVLAHEFFQLSIENWLAADPKETSERGDALVTALMGLLEMVVIDLSPGDDPHVIFETLNARGTPLLQSDLVKNFVLQQASKLKLDAEALQKQHWSTFETEWWREDIRQGRLVRPRLDVLLNYWLIARRVEEVQSHDVFQSFRDYASGDGQHLVATVADAAAAGVSYRSFQGLDDWSPQGVFRYRWGVMDAGVSTPLILALLTMPGLSDDRLHRSLRVVESYLVRRMLCRMTTKDYNRLFLDLLERLNTREGEEVDDLIVGYLSAQESESRLWPGDAMLTQSLVELPLYRLLTRGRTRFVLEAIEDSLRTAKSEEEHVARGALTIEHVLPQHWGQHWPLPPADNGSIEDLEATRNHMLHTIGNLTLVNGRLNPALSNGAWEVKRPELAKHSVLHLNKELVDEWPETWGEYEIRQRSALLAERVCSIWEGPGAVFQAQLNP